MSTAAETVIDYYEALRRGEPLEGYFAESPAVTKFGIEARLYGTDAIAEALREQTRTTDDWEVRSNDLRVTERDCHAWFSDVVDLAWTEGSTDERRSFETRWSGTLERSGEEWLFVSMHVSAGRDL